MPLPFILAGAAIAAAGFGAKKGYDGYQDKTRANEIIDKSKRKYETSRKVFDGINSEIEQGLNQLGELQLNIGKTFKEFSTLAHELINKIDEKTKNKINLSLPKHKREQIEQLSISAVDYLGKVAGGGVAGAASAYAVYGGVMALAAASTGTPLAALNGIAAYNAALAAIGGGSIASGGLGIAGGTMILGGVVAAPIIAVAGWAFASHAEGALSNAFNVAEEVDEAIIKLEFSGERLTITNNYIKEIFKVTEEVFKSFLEYFDLLKEVNYKKNNNHDMDQLQDDIVRGVQNGFAIASILTDIITTPLFVAKKDSGGKIIFEDGLVVIKTDKHGMNIFNAKKINKVLNKKHKKI